jgi:putative transposase
VLTYLDTPSCHTAWKSSTKDISGDDDYLYYIELLSTLTKKYGTGVWSYCLMLNHIHLVMAPSEEDGLRTVLGEGCRRYTRYINFHEGWHSYLWQECFHLSYG